MNSNGARASLEVEQLGALLSRLDLRPAVAAGADRFVTNNRSDFPTGIVEVAVTYPEDLAGPAT